MGSTMAVAHLLSSMRFNNNSGRSHWLLFAARFHDSTSPQRSSLPQVSKIRPATYWGFTFLSSIRSTCAGLPCAFKPFFFLCLCWSLHNVFVSSLQPLSSLWNSMRQPLSESAFRYTMIPIRLLFHLHACDGKVKRMKKYLFRTFDIVNPECANGCVIQYIKAKTNQKKIINWWPDM